MATAWTIFAAISAIGAGVLVVIAWATFEPPSPHNYPLPPIRRVAPLNRVRRPLRHPYPQTNESLN